MAKRPEAGPPRPLLTTKDVAKRCLVSERSVRRWIAAGDLKVHRLGGRVRISEEDYQSFLKSCRD